MRFIIFSLILFSFFACDEDEVIIKDELKENTIQYFDIEPNISVEKEWTRSDEILLNHPDDRLLNDFVLNVDNRSFDYGFTITISLKMESGAIAVYSGQENGILGGMGAPYPISTDSVINSNLYWDYSCLIKVHDVDFYSNDEFYFMCDEYYDAINRYYGMKFSHNGEDYYGWFKMDINDSLIIISEYAYNTIPFEEIKAGHKNNGD